MANSPIPRAEYPHPQFVRQDWINLNGDWTCALDTGKSGAEQNWMASKGFDRRIVVPFCPESRLSQIHHTDFIEEMWYHRTFVIPRQWGKKDIDLHFGAVDYYCEIFIDGKLAGRHWGGSSSFQIDITLLVRSDTEHDLVVRVLDNVRSRLQPAGKQSLHYSSCGCQYTRVTGIWQTVWLEAVPRNGLDSCDVRADLFKSTFHFTPRFRALESGLQFRVRVLDRQNGAIYSIQTNAAQGITAEVSVEKARLWSPADPFLYEITYEIVNKEGTVIDTIESYAGMRSVRIEHNRILLNGEPLYLRLVLDQGFYPDGIWTAPGDDDLKRDIELSIQAGFNGARLHQKAFEPRFHYWADKLGYLTWAESPSWGMDISNEIAARNFLTEWRELVVRDRNHPSIIAWTPFNETIDPADVGQHSRLIADIYELTRNLDPTRPINDTSGYLHVRTDVWTVHTYEQNPEKLKEQLAIKNGLVFRNYPEKEAPYEGQPYIVAEFGGTRWAPGLTDETGNKHSWGYGETPEELESFYIRIAGLVAAIRQQEHICGFCYTQLTDVEQEQNGIYFYNRAPKFDLHRIRQIFGT